MKNVTFCTSPYIQQTVLIVIEGFTIRSNNKNDNELNLYRTFQGPHHHIHTSGGQVHVVNMTNGSIEANQCQMAPPISHTFTQCGRLTESPF